MMVAKKEKKEFSGLSGSRGGYRVDVTRQRGDKETTAQEVSSSRRPKAVLRCATAPSSQRSDVFKIYLLTWIENS
jgi:hypothetical protein